jgi:hypothetical protein
LNKEFRKEYGIPTIMPIPADLNNLIESAWCLDMRLRGYTIVYNTSPK